MDGLNVAFDFSVTSLLLILVSSLVGYFLLSWVFSKTPKNLPPGPRGFKTSVKFLKASLNGTLHELATEWAKEYGEIYYVNIFGNVYVFLNNADITRRIFTADDMKVAVADRVPTAAPSLAWYKGKDIVFATYDAQLKKKRKLFFQLMGIYGDGVGKFEDIVLGEMNRLFKELEEHEGKDFDLANALSRSLKVIIYILVLGELPPDPNTPDVLEEFDMSFNKLWDPVHDFALTTFPFLSKFSKTLQTAVDRVKRAQKAAEKLVYFSPKETYVPGKPRGIADLLFEQAKKPGYEFLQEDPEQTMAYLLTIFSGAHLTSRALILGIFLSVLNYPEVAKNIQKEIDDVLGERPPKVEDRANMPYTEATILEILRVVSQIPLAGMRHVTSDITFEGMTIPKHTILVTNQWYYNHDEKLWNEPWKVKPERFLTSSGDILPAHDPVRKAILPFGIGLRSCPGEVFGRSRAFMFITSILQKYDLLPPANEELVPADFRSNDEYVKGFIRQVLPFKCRLQRRKRKVVS